MRLICHSHVVVCLVVSVSTLTFAQVRHQHHPPRSASEYAGSLENQARDAWQKPHEVVEALRLKPGEVVADIGAGTGYFTRRFVRHGAKVLAVDVEEALFQEHWKGGDANVTKVLAKMDDPMLPVGGVDTVFFCNVVHHLDGRAAYFAKVRKALKPEGRVVVLDFHKRELPVGPPPGMKISREEMVKEWEAAGFRLAAEQTFLPNQYFLEFRPR
jgi:predicted methyltransferase